MKKFIVITSTSQSHFEDLVNDAIAKGYVPIGQPIHNVETQITSSTHLEQLYFGTQPVAVTSEKAKSIDHFCINMILK